MKNKKTKKILISIIIFLITILVLNSNGIIKNTTQVQKEMSETTQVSQLNSQIDILNNEHDEYKRYIENSKAQIAEAITFAGVNTEGTDSFEIMANNIKNIKNEGLNEFAFDRSNSIPAGVKTAYLIVSAVTDYSGAIISITGDNCISHETIINRITSRINSYYISQLMVEKIYLTGDEGVLTINIKRQVDKGNFYYVYSLAY